MLTNTDQQKGKKDPKLPNVMKKPQGHIGSLKRPASSAQGGPLKKPMMRAQSQASESEDGGAVKRDRVKARYLQKNEKKLPQDVQAVLNTATRAEKSLLINAMVQKRSDTRAFEFKLDDPTFQKQITKFKEKTAGTKTRGLPRTLMVAQCGGEDAFQHALQSGEIQEVEADGRSYYSFVEMQVVDKSGVTSNEGVSGKKGLSQEKFEEIDQALSSFQVFMSKKKISQGSSSSKGASKTPEEPIVYKDKLAEAEQLGMGMLRNIKNVLQNNEEGKTQLKVTNSLSLSSFQLNVMAPKIKQHFLSPLGPVRACLNEQQAVDRDMKSLDLEQLASSSHRIPLIQCCCYPKFWEKKSAI